LRDELGQRFIVGGVVHRRWCGDVPSADVLPRGVVERLQLV
jgi:hypothetical protein